MACRLHRHDNQILIESALEMTLFRQQYQRNINAQFDVHVACSAYVYAITAMTLSWRQKERLVRQVFIIMVRPIARHC